jgi:acetyl esterase/lipase
VTAFHRHFLSQALWALLVLVGCTSCATGQHGVDPPEPVLREADVTYAEAAGAALKLDLAWPATGRGPFPAIVFLHGGGFHSGSRNHWYSETIQAALRGYVGVSIDYRLTSVLEGGKPKYTFPAQVHDAKCAVRWLRANAAKYSIDADRIGVVGFSAGGNLALMLGLTEPSDGFEGDCGDSRLPSRVQAVVNLAGGADLTLHHQYYKAFYEALLGGTLQQVPERYKTASPITYVGGNDPPVLTICGTLDPSLPQQKFLDDRMKNAHESHTLIVVEGAGHDLFSLVNFYQDNRVWTFFDQHLKSRRWRPV